MIKDSKAESLEAKGLFRRAASRWAEVMYLSNNDREWEMAKRRRDSCLEKAKLPPVPLENYHDITLAIKETQRRMGLLKPNGEAWRKPQTHIEERKKKGG